MQTVFLTSWIWSFRARESSDKVYAERELWIFRGEEGDDMELVSMNVRKKAAAKAASRITETDKTVQEKFGTASGSLFENARIHYTMRGSADAKTFLPNRAGRADRESAIQMMMRAGREQVAAVEEAGAEAHVARAVTPRDLYAFGNRNGPRGVRANRDMHVENEESMVGPERPPFPKGASTFSTVDGVDLTGHYHKLQGGTVLPEGLGVIADGRDVHEDEPRAHGAGHHTIFPAVRMQFGEFNRLFTTLPWEYQGNRRPERQRQAGVQGRF